MSEDRRASSSFGGVSTIADDALQAASWDLEPLVGGRGAEGVEEMLADARERAGANGVTAFRMD